jgi:hypothetical protein
MRRLLRSRPFTGGLFLLFLGWFAAPASASCRYFRTAYKVSACKDIQPTVSTSTKTVSNDIDAPWLENEEGPRRQLLCVCTYVLQGSDPRCDFDKIEEVPASVSKTETGPNCELAINVCGEVCARTTDL